MKEKLFNQYENMIYKQSWHYANKFNLDYNDVQSEAFIIFCKAVESFDERQAQFSTYLYNKLKSLTQICMKEKNRGVRVPIRKFKELLFVDIENTAELEYENSSFEEILFNELAEEEKLVLENLPEREQFIIEETFGLSGWKSTYEEIGYVLGITSESVRLIRNKTLKHLKYLGKNLKKYLKN
jgi:RNA polymerase sigma factor (sigma-70 family)